MKRILVTLFIISITSAATAGITLSVLSTGSLTEGGTVEMGLTSDTGFGDSGYVWLDYATSNSAGDELSLIIRDPIIMGNLSFTDGYYLPDGFYFSADGGPGGPPTTGLWLTFNLTATGTLAGNDIRVDLLDEGLNIIDSVFVPVVPEPMTISLLALGGLMIRRRK